MRRYGMVIAIGLLVLVNVVVLGGVAYNRTGEPDATVTLTERELPLSSYYGYADRENTGLSLHLNWSQSDKNALTSGRRRDRHDWFDKAKLEAVGFDCSMPLDDPRAELHYYKMLPRKTFVVMEYNGTAWEAWLADEQNKLLEMVSKVKTGEISQKQLREARQEYDREARTHSRLFVVDAGNDPAVLRQQYGKRGRCLVLPATVRVVRHKPGVMGDDFSREPWRLTGSIDGILTDEIYVPKEHRAVLEKLLRTDRQIKSGDYSPYAQRQRGPSYEVKLYVGKRCEPWVAGVSPLAPETVK